MFAAQGARDRVVARESFEVMRAELLARGRDAVVELVEDADHGFAVKGEPRSRGWEAILTRVVDWYLAP